MNDDGDWWVPVEDVKSFKEARKKITDCLSYEIPEDGTLRYIGKEINIVCDKHTADEIPYFCNKACSRKVLCYHFLENRKW